MLQDSKYAPELMRTALTKEEIQEKNRSRDERKPKKVDAADESKPDGEAASEGAALVCCFENVRSLFGEKRE
jgi:hypothetical protein